MEIKAKLILLNLKYHAWLKDYSISLKKFYCTTFHHNLEANIPTTKKTEVITFT